MKYQYIQQHRLEYKKPLCLIDRIGPKLRFMSEELGSNRKPLWKAVYRQKHWEDESGAAGWRQRWKLPECGPFVTGQLLPPVLRPGRCSVPPDLLDAFLARYLAGRIGHFEGKFWRKHCIIGLGDRRN